jgi:hypothetical protein
MVQLGLRSSPWHQARRQAPGTWPGPVIQPVEMTNWHQAGLLTRRARMLWACLVAQQDRRAGTGALRLAVRAHRTGARHIGRRLAARAGSALLAGWVARARRHRAGRLVLRLSSDPVTMVIPAMRSALAVPA